MSTKMELSPDTASMLSFDEALNETERERARFMAQLSEFPHTFQLQDADCLGNTKIRRLLTGLQSALRVGYKTQLETARAKNLLAFLLHCQDRHDEALEELDKVLETEGQHNNLVTLANKAVILWHQRRLTEADELVDTLREIQKDDRDFGYLVVKAKAELAFAYTRMGPKIGHLAKNLFQTVIPQARANEPEEWLWKFGLALTCRRQLRDRPTASSPEPSRDIVDKQRRVLELLMDIVQNCPCANLRAKTYAEIALLLNAVSKSPHFRDFTNSAGVNLAQACEKALSLDSDDNSVLCKCGRIFRYIRRTEESRELLERAVSIRPSATGYHHLGLTYKCLATAEKYKHITKRPGFYRELSRQHSKQNHTVYDDHANSNTDTDSSVLCDLSNGLHQLSVGPPAPRISTQGNHPPPLKASTYSRSLGTMGGDRNSISAAMGSQTLNGVVCPDGILSPDGTPKFSLDRDVRVMQRVAKSPPGGVTQFTRVDKYAMETLHNLQLAVEFSGGENTAAIKDLAIFQRALNELPAARKTLQQALKRQDEMYAWDQITVFEQMGLITKEMAESEVNEVMKQRMLKDSNSMLLMALKTAAVVFSKSPWMQEKVGEVWRSLPTLLQAVEQSDKNPRQKLKEKAKLFQLIKDHKQTLSLLKQIEQMDPDKVQEPEYLKLCIVEYVATKKFEDALAFMALLEFTPKLKETMESFGDTHFVLKIYLHAARQALLQNNTIARSHLWHVFQETAVRNAEEPSSSEDTDASEDTRREEETWDVTILHDDDVSDKAIAMAEILHKFCGLRVPIMDRDLPANRLELEGVLRMMRRSSLVVVMAGQKPVSRELRYYIHFAASRPSTVTLLVAGDHVPEMLRRHRSKPCPEEVFTLRDQEIGAPGVDALCEVFSFIVGVDMNKLNLDTSDP